MSNHQPIIIVDTREKIPWRFNKSKYCMGSISQKLDLGDYSIIGMQNIFVVERKGSAAELYRNLGIDKVRFIKEMEGLKSFKYKFLIIECDVKDIIDFPTIIKKYGKKTVLTPQYIFSQLVEIRIKYGVEFMFIGSMKKDKDRKKIKQFLNRFFYKFYNMYMNGNLP